MYHVPHHLVAAGHPAVAVHGLVTVDAHEILAAAGQVAVELGGGDCHGLVAGKAGRGLAQGGKYGGQMLLELLLQSIVDTFLKLVDLFPQGLTLVQRYGLYLSLDLGDARLVGSHRALDIGADVGHGAAQLVVGLGGHGRAQGIYLSVDKGAVALLVAARLGAEDAREE